MTTEVRPSRTGIRRTVRRYDRRPSVKLVALGMLLLQLVWVFAVPPFRGSDEFDHVYKAAAVARGDWIPEPSAATRNTGAWLQVPSDLVKAARPQCQALPYTTDADCVGTESGGVVTVASGAGRYNPIYYGVVGSVAIPFSGVAALYVMRIATVLLSWSLFVCALWVTRRWARNAWPTTCLVIATTPVAVYSSSVVAPNGVEMMAALAFWSTLVGIAQSATTPVARSTILIATLSGCVLVTLRSLGPVWCLLALLTVALSGLVQRGLWRQLLVDKAVWLGALALVTATLLSTWWILHMDSADLGVQAGKEWSFVERAKTLSEAIPLWILQSIGAFPARNEPTVPIVYACYILLFALLFILAFKHARKTLRFVLITTFMASWLIPWLIGIATYNSFPGVWQGRYGLPYSVGIAIIAGAVLNSWGRNPVRHVRIAGFGLFTIGQVVSPLYVALTQGKVPVSVNNPWLLPPMWLLSALALVAASSIWWKATERLDQP